MKFSIIIGVIQMLFGILLKGMNGWYFNKQVDVWFEALPQFLFMALTFGYMAFCIMVKWLTDWTGREPVSIIQLFINLTSVSEPLYLTKEIQQIIQITFVVISLVCVLLMLFPKPFILSAQAKQHKTRLHENHQEHNRNLIHHVI